MVADFVDGTDGQKCTLGGVSPTQPHVCPYAPNKGRTIRPLAGRCGFSCAPAQDFGLGGYPLDGVETFASGGDGGDDEAIALLDVVEDDLFL